LRGRDLLYVHAVLAVDGGDAAVLFEAVGVGCQLDESCEEMTERNDSVTIAIR
jgi:hypothetical protein